MITYVLIALLALASVAVFTPLTGVLAARLGLVDRPDGWRKRHLRIVPNVGGVAMAAAFALAWIAGVLFVAAPLPAALVHGAAQPAALWIGAGVILLAGLYDDAFGLRCNYKLLLQVAAAYTLIHGGFRIDVSILPFVADDAYVQALYSLPLTILWTVAIINAVNLLDGLDGLAAGVSLIAVTALASAFALRGEFGMLFPAVVLAGVLAGFLLHNSHPAKIFMGDCGSMLLGYLIAAMTLGGFGGPATLDQLVVGAVTLGLPFVDTTVAIGRRLLERRPIFGSDHDHIHHRLLKRYGHRGAVFTLYGVSLVYGIMAVLLAVIEFRYWIFPALALAIATRLFLTSLGYPTVASVLKRLTTIEEREPARIVDLHERIEERAA